MLLALANVLICLHHPVLAAKHVKRFGRLPNVSRPGNQPERMLWRKIFDRNPTYRLMLDKLGVREFVRARCPGLALSEVVFVGVAPEIPEALVNDRYVIKTNNGSGRNLFPDASTTRAAAEADLRYWLEHPYGKARGEWGYSDILPVAYVERRVTAPPGGAVIEINCHVAMGRCFVVSVLQDAKTPAVRRALFAPDGTRLPFGAANARRDRPIAALGDDFRLPPAFAQIVAYAETLGADCDYVRIDFLCARDRFWFGEFTVFHQSGKEALPDPVERLFAANWDVRNAWFARQPWRGPRGWYVRLLRAAS